MFEWLEREVRSVKTPHFFEIEGPASAELRNAVEHSRLAIPPSYREFVLRFGNAKLYRYSSNYYVTIFAGPRGATDSNGDPYVHFGRTWTSFAYFMQSLLDDGKECPVFEWFDNGIRQTANSFDEWLYRKCEAARKRFTRQEWKMIVEGPTPFTEQEEAIAAARSQFNWRVLGVADNGDLRFEVHNGSELILPYLSVGIRYKGGEAFGGVKVPISHVAPGHTSIVDVDCYKATHDPGTIEAFQLPDPEPALRDLFWEFRKS